MAGVKSPSSLKILVRGSGGLSVWTGPPFVNGQPLVQLDKVPCTNAKFSEDGSKLLVMQSESLIGIYDCQGFKETRCFEIPNIVAATLSPCGTYLQTFQKPSTSQEKNVRLWKIDIDASVYQHFQKNMTKATWPAILFSSNEAVACRLVTNEIQFFDVGDFSKGIIYRIRIPGVTAVELSKGLGSHMAAFVPESKGAPASVQIVGCQESSQGQPVARRSFFRCSTVKFVWNHSSTGLLVMVQSDVDKTNQSYYGESKLNYLTTDGAHEGLVPLRKEGPVHDVQWSYSDLQFAVVYGFMPARATIFDKKCNPLLELGTGPYNTIRWNPNGRFLCLAGFGNLPGDMAFWDYSEKKQLRATRAEWSVTSEWSPDGCYFMTATTAPRMQVDNGIKIFHYDGSLHFQTMLDKLYQVEWKPESADKSGEISELIKLVDTSKIGETKNEGKGLKSGAYRPPHAKNAAAVQAQLFGGSTGEEVSKNASRNKKKRDKKREKKAADAAQSAADL